MNASKPILVVSVVFGMITAAPATAASNHQNQHKYDTHSQSSPVLHTARAAKPAPTTISNPKPDVNATAASGSAVEDPQTALDTLAVQHKDKGWKSNHESWCDVDPNCSGWNKNMQAYEQTVK